MSDSSNYIVTAANQHYFKNLKQLIYSFKRAGEHKNSTLVIYDIGLSPEQAEQMKRIGDVPENRIVYHLFQFEDYPEFVKPQYNTYSWKPIIIHLVSNKYNGNFLWMDSANCILKNLSPIWLEIANTCTYAPISGSGTLKEWTVQATLDYLKTPKHFYSKRNRAGNTFGFSTSCHVVVELINKWKDLALIRECIRPEGANRSNHRDDQSLLTILLLEQEEKGKLVLTNEEVNISSAKPSKFISVRNIFPKTINLKNGELAHQYFLIVRAFDIFINKLLKFWH